MSLVLDIDVFTLLYVIEERKNLCIPWAHGQFIGTQWQHFYKAVVFIFLSSDIYIFNKNSSSV